MMAGFLKMSEKLQNARPSREQAEIIVGVLHGMGDPDEDRGLLPRLPDEFEKGEHESQYTRLDEVDD